MRQPISNNKVGDKFSLAFDNLRCTGDLSKMQAYQTYYSDILSIWECTATGNKFAIFVNSGIREITETLYQDQLNYFFAHCDIV